MSVQKKIRFGVLGCSRIAQKAALPAIIASELAELRIVGSRTTDSARACAERFGCTSFGTYQDVLDDSGVDAVYISLPNSLHEEWAVKAAEAGKHVWCEKPAALTYASAKRMVETTHKSGVRLMEGFMFLHHPQHARVQALIKEGVIGEVVSFDGVFSFPIPEAGNIRLNAQLGGGAYYDGGVYPIRASRFIFDEEPETIRCITTIDENIGVDVQAEATLTYPGGGLAHIMSAFSEDYRSTYTVRGSKGTIEMERAYAVPPDRAVTILLTRDGQTEKIGIGAVDQFLLMVDDFCTEILTGNVNTKEYEEDLLAQARVVEAGQRSYQEQRTVGISEL